MLAFEIVYVLLDQPTRRFDYGQAERWSVDVITDGEHHVGKTDDGGQGTVREKNHVNQVGRTLATLLASDAEGVRIPRGVELEWFWEEILAAIARAERHTQR